MIIEVDGQRMEVPDDATPEELDALTATSRVLACSIRVMGLPCQVTQMFSSLPMLPSQWNFCASNRPAFSPNSGSMATPLVNAAKVSPSGAALL